MHENINEEDVSHYKLISQALLFLAAVGTIILAYLIVDKADIFFEIVLLIKIGIFLVSLLFYFLAKKLYQKYRTISWVSFILFIAINCTNITIGLIEVNTYTPWPFG